MVGFNGWLLWVLQRLWVVGLAGSLCLVSLTLYDFGSFFMVVVIDSRWWWCAVGMVAIVVEVFKREFHTHIHLD